MGPAAGAVALAAARLRRARVHQRALPVPGRAAVRARREPDRRLPAAVRRCPRTSRGRRVLRFEGVDSCARVWVNGDYVGTSRGSRLPAEFAVGALLRRGRRERARGARAPVVLGLLPRGPGHVVAVGDLPRRVADRAAGGRARRRLRARRLRPRHGDGAPARGRRRGARVLVPELGIDVAAGETVAVERVEPWSAEVPRLYDATVVRRGRARDAADRLPARGDRGRAADGQRAPRAVPRRQPARVRPALGARGAARS